MFTSGYFNYFILQVIICIFGIQTAYSDNPTSIIDPYNGPDPGYIIAESTSGLSNRLRVLAAYMYIAEYKFEGAHTVFIWDKTSACPGHFLSIFEPIPDVIFATNSSRYVLDKHAKIVYENSFAVFPWIMQMNNIPKNRHGLPTWSEIEHRMYSRYIPNRDIMIKATKFIEKHNICNSSAMHLRTTDLDRLMNERKRTNIHSYFKFVESRPEEEKIFLLTDDPKTQKIFLRKFGPQKIIVYNEIAEAHEQPPLFVLSGGNRTITSAAASMSGTEPTATASATLAEDHRFTTLEHTLIDVIVAAHAKIFKPSGFSSLSDLVKMFESIGKQSRGWCQ